MTTEGTQKLHIISYTGSDLQIASSNCEQEFFFKCPHASHYALAVSFVFFKNHLNMLKY